MKKKLTIEDVIRDYSENIRAIAKKFYISDGSTEDLFQEGLIGLIQGYNSYDLAHGEIGSDAFKSFLLMCAKRQIIDAVKKSNSKRNSPMNNFVSLSSDDFVETSDIASLTAEPLEDKVINKMTSMEDGLTILDLSSFENEVLNLYLEGLKQSQIATILSKPVKSIDNTLQRIKTKLKRNK